MAGDDERTPNVIVWFEDTPAGRAALFQAHWIAENRQVHLTVLAVAMHERVIGCGRCLQGTVIWNLEMKKIGHEELVEARALLEDPDVDYVLGVGRPADAIRSAAQEWHAGTVVIPWQRNRRLDPPYRRNVDRQLTATGVWDVVVGPQPHRRTTRSRLAKA